MDNGNLNPDSLLKTINKSILAKGIIIAVAVHAVVLFATSISLYKDWAKYGIKTPSAIKAEKKQEKIEEEKARREAEIKRKAEEAAIAQSNAVPVKATAETKALSRAAEDKPKEEEEKAVRPPELEPLPPATGEISLDEIGL